MGLVGQDSTSHDGKRQAGSPNNNPDGGTDGHIIPTLPVSGLEGLEKEEAALQTDTCQEADTCIHVEVLQVEAEKAQEPWEGPVVVDVVIDPQWQREHMGKVSHRQIDHEDDGLVLLADEAAQDPEGCTVGQEARNEDHDICDSIQGVLEWQVKTSTIYFCTVPFHLEYLCCFCKEHMRKKDPLYPDIL